MPFDYTLDFRKTDFRAHPELYRVGIGEQGVLLVEPYKSEILPHWRFKTAEIATESAQTIFGLFLDYKRQSDFVGMDMARKFLQMGYTRARRYANHPGGRKYASNPQKAPTPEEEKAMRREVLPQATDWATGEKARAAEIFYDYYRRAKDDPEYLAQKRAHQERYGK